MYTNSRNTDSKLPSGVCGFDNANEDGNMPKSIWHSCIRSVGNYVRQLCKVCCESNESNVTSQSSKSSIPAEPNKCSRHLERNCNCSSGSCADDDSGSDVYGYTKLNGRAVAIDKYNRVITPKPNKYGNFTCPVNHLACSTDVCQGYCVEGSSLSSKT